MTTIREITALQGQLVMVNLRSQQCGIELVNGTYQENIHFAETLTEIIKASLQHEVYLIGWQVQDQRKKHKLSFEIHEIYSLDTNSTPQQLQELLARYRTEHDTHTNLREGLREALTGQTRPIAELWDGMDVE